MRDGLGRVATAALLAAFACCLACSAAIALSECSRGEQGYARAHGMPLDAQSVTEYDQPAWLPACDHAYMVFDRQRDEGWWLLVMNEGEDGESYVALPLSGEEDR